MRRSEPWGCTFRSNRTQRADSMTLSGTPKCSCLASVQDNGLHCVPQSLARVFYSLRCSVRDVGVAVVGQWPVCLPLLPGALMAWNIAHLAKGSLSVPPPDRVEAASCFSCLNGQGGTLSQIRVRKCSLILVRGKRSIYILDGLTATTAGETVQEAGMGHPGIQRRL